MAYITGMETKRDKRIIVPLSQAEVDAIDDWRFAYRMPSRAEAIRVMLRRFVDQGMEKAEKSVEDRP